MNSRIGEGCFKVKVSKSLTTKTGFRVLLVFQISQHCRDELLMEKLVSYFGCGKIEKYSRDSCVPVHLVDNYEKIIF